MAKSSSKGIYAASGPAFFGCMLIGTGIGYAFDPKQAGIGWIIGTGVGFLVMAVMRYRG